MKGRIRLSRGQSALCSILALAYFIFLGRVLWHRYRVAAFNDAVERGDINRVESLLRWGPPPKVNGHSYTIWASGRGDERMAQLFIRAGDNPNVGLCVSASHGLVGLMEQQMAQGANPNEQCEGSSVLMIASAKGPKEVRLLLDRGADVNYVEIKGMLAGETALTRAILVGNPETVRLLLDRGAKTELWFSPMTPNGPLRIHSRPQTPRDAADYKRLRGSSGPSNPNLSITPLMYAAMRGNVEIVDLLVKHGARLDEHDAAGGTALSIARDQWKWWKWKGCDRVAKLLEASGAKG